MSKKVNPIPQGYHTLTPYLVIKNAGSAIDLYKKVFGATETFRMEAPGGKVGHAELKIGDSVIMMAEEHLEMGFKGPETLGGSPLSLLVYVEDVNVVSKRAVEAGMKVLKPVADQFYGDRMGTFLDPFGHIWSIASHVEDVPPEELKKRAAQAHADCVSKE